MGLSSLHTAAPEPLQVVPVSQLNALLFGLLEPLVVAMKAQTAATAALSEKVTQLMTNQAALDAQDAILAADVNTLTTVTQNVVTGVATLNNTNQALTAEVASLQSQLAAGQPLNLTNLVNLTNGVSAANALLLAAVAPVTAPAPPAAAPAAPNPAGTAPAPAAPPTGGTS